MFVTMAFEFNLICNIFNLVSRVELSVRVLRIDHEVLKKNNLYCIRGITPKRVTSGGAHLRGLAPGQHSSEETSLRWRAVDDTVSI